MSGSEDFLAHVRELLAPAGRVTTKRMFGGHGVYLDGLFIAIIVEDELYLKVDDITRPAFETEGCAPFVYARDGKPMTMRYYRAPGEALDAPHLMRPWARRALEAALRMQAAKPAKLPALMRSAKRAAPKKKAAKKNSSRPAIHKRPK
jgi:DNA transformation protein